MRISLQIIVLGTFILSGCANSPNTEMSSSKSPSETKSKSTDKQPNEGQSTMAINPADAKTVAIHLVKPASTTPIVITSPDFPPGGEIPYTFSDYGDKISPRLSWTGVPSEAKSIVLLMEDPDAKMPKPFIHWVMYDLSPGVKELRKALPGDLLLAQYDNTPQGMNSRGSVGYMGPRPPYKDGAHHYHFMIFALDKKLGVLPGLDRASILAAMKDHVLASGVLVGTYKAADPK